MTIGQGLWIRHVSSNMRFGTPHAKRHNSLRARCEGVAEHRQHNIWVIGKQTMPELVYLMAEGVVLPLQRPRKLVAFHLCRQHGRRFGGLPGGAPENAHPRKRVAGAPP